MADLFPGKWALTSGSDAHSLFTAGYNWTEFPGSTADDFRKAILDKTTVPMGEPAPVLGQVQWSMEVVWGGQKLMYKSLRHQIKDPNENALVRKIESINDLKKATGIVAGFAYEFPLTVMLATTLSTSFLKKKAKIAMTQIDERLASIKELGEKHGFRTAD